MLGIRLETANKIAQKRFDYYHRGTFTLFGIGVYRKRKGCECRRCTRERKFERVKRNAASRKPVLDLGIW